MGFYIEIVLVTSVIYSLELDNMKPSSFCRPARLDAIPLLQIHHLQFQKALYMFHHSDCGVLCLPR